MTAMDAHSIVMTELEKVDGPKKDVKNRVMVQCPFHDERTPSCGVVVVTDSRYEIGSFNCLGCGAHGNWNTFADKLGLQQIGKLTPKKGMLITSGYKTKLAEIKGSMLSQKKENIEQMMISLGSPAFRPWPVASEWREYPGWLIYNMGGYVAVGGKKGSIHQVQCLFPVKVGKDLVGAVKAKTKKVEGQLSYVASEGDWVKEKGLFPYHYTKEMLRRLKGKRFVFLVEGPRDAMRLLLNGIPALAILGSQNISKKKLELLRRLELDYIFVLPDNDNAGKAMAKKIKWFVDEGKVNTQAKVDYYELPRDRDKKGNLIKLDPDNMPIDLLKHLVSDLKAQGCLRLKTAEVKEIVMRIK